MKRLRGHGESVIDLLNGCRVLKTIRNKDGKCALVAPENLISGHKLALAHLLWLTRQALEHRILEELVQAIQLLIVPPSGFTHGRWQSRGNMYTETVARWLPDLLIDATEEWTRLTYDALPDMRFCLDHIEDQYRFSYRDDATNVTYRHTLAQEQHLTWTLFDLLIYSGKLRPAAMCYQKTAVFV